MTQVLKLGNWAPGHVNAFTISRTDIHCVPKLNVPAFRDEHCEEIRLSARLILSPEKFAALRQRVTLEQDGTLRLSARRLGPASDSVRRGIRERLTIHEVPADEAREESEAMREVDPSYPAPGDIAAHVHLEIAVETVPDGAVEDLTSSDAIAEALDWLRSNVPVEVVVTAFRFFEEEEYEPLVAFPPATKPFTSVKGLTLVKETDSTQPGALAYEARVRSLEDGLLSVTVLFRSLLAPGADALERLLETASEIAAFAVRRRVTSPSL